MNGKAFFESTGFYGAPLVIKLGDIVGVIDESPESLSAGRADKSQDKKEDALLE